MTTANAKPNVADWVVNGGLYSQIPLNQETLVALHELEHLDLYCYACGKERHFKLVGKVLNGLGQVVRDNFSRVIVPTPWPIDIVMDFRCSRDDTAHRVAFYLRTFESSFVKVGQHPSVADQQAAAREKYRKAYPVDFDELNRAVGLFSHGIGIGSFVYLRRIFERRLEDSARARLADEPAFDIEAWRTLRVDDKIEALKDRLPTFLVTNRKALYGILSKGIHEMSEDDCRTNFRAVVVAIELVLDQALSMREQIEKEKAAAAALQQVAQRIAAPPAKKK